MNSSSRYRQILELLIQQVHESLPSQVLDPTRRCDGCFLDSSTGFPNADHTSHSARLAALIQVWLAPESPLAGDPRLIDRILRGIAFLRRWQRPTGLIDLPKVDIDSPPDTAFSVQLFAPLLAYARQHGATELDAALTPYVVSAAAGIVGRGFRTPNHRWVVVSALAQAMTLFPELRATAAPYCASILAEGIDINADGEYSERSTGIYNAVVNRALRYIAEHLNRPELLDHVRANLRFIAALLEDDGTVITTISGRQDRGGRQVPITMADSYLDLAHRDGDAAFAGVVDLLFSAQVAKGQREPHGWGWLLQPYLDQPALRSAVIPACPPPVSRSHLWPASKLWFVKEGPLAAFASAGTAIPFALRCGDVELRGLRMANTFFHHGVLVGQALEPLPGGVRVVGKPYHHGWDLPLGRPVSYPDCGEYYRIAGSERQHWDQPAVAMAAEVVREDDGFSFNLTSDTSYARIPAQVELSFAGPGEWRTADAVMVADAGSTVRLRRGWGLFRRGNHAIRIDLEGVADDHAWWELPALPADHGGFRVVLNLQTPVACRLRLQVGRWSPANPDSVLPLNGSLCEPYNETGVKTPCVDAAVA